MKKKIKRKATLLLLFAFVPAMMQAGWVFTDSYGEKSWLQDGKVKFSIDEEGSFMVIDFNTGDLLMVNPQREIYTRISMDEYCDFMTQMLEGMEEEGEEKEQGLDANIENVGLEKMAGVNCNHYKVYIDGELYEEIWVADHHGIMKEAGKPGYRQKFADCGPSDLEALSNLEAYNDLLTRGWEMKTVSYYDGMADVDHEVVKLEEIDIPASAFKAPSGFKSVDFQAYVMKR